MSAYFWWLFICVFLFAMPAPLSAHTDHLVDFSIRCPNDTTYNTSGLASDLETILDRVFAFCADQDKSFFENMSGKTVCYNFMVKSSKADTIAKPERFCRDPYGKWHGPGLK